MSLIDVIPSPPIPTPPVDPPVGGNPGGGVSNATLADAVGLWEFDELGNPVSGTDARVSSVGTHGLEFHQRNNPSLAFYAEGHKGAASVFTSSDVAYDFFAHSANASYNDWAEKVGFFCNSGGDFSLGVAFYPTVDTTGTIIGVGTDQDLTSDASGYNITMHSTGAGGGLGGKVTFNMYSGTSEETAVSQGSWTLNEWNFALIRFRSANNRQGISLNGSAFRNNNSAFGMDQTPVGNTSYAVLLSTRSTDTTTGRDQKFRGYISQLVLWHEHVSQKAASDWYNGGAGITGASEATFSYATVSAAEASGDTWAEADWIWCNGVLFLYDADFDVDGHSGLAHRDIFGDGSLIVASGGLLFSHAAGVDPDSLSGQTDASVGTKGVDYDFDTDAGRTRYRALTTSGYPDIRDGNAPSTAQSVCFAVLDDCSGAWSGANAVNVIMASGDGASGYRQVQINAATATFSGNWSLFDGAGNNTGIDASVGTRLWLYMDGANDKSAIWIDSGTGPELVGTTYALATPRGIMRTCFGNGDPRDLLHGYLVNGTLST